MSASFARGCFRAQQARLWLLLMLGTVSVPAAAASAELRPEDVEATSSYRIEANLDAPGHRVLATGTIVWHNPSSRPVTALWLHAYLNAFASDRTLFFRSGQAPSRSHQTLGQPGGLTLTRLVARELGHLDLLPRLASHSPGDPDDATDLSVALPEAIAPGETLTLEVSFLAQLPALVERSGWAESFFAVAQWFPKLARLDAQGHWHHFAFHPFAEFDADFGTYDVTIDVPSDFALAAPGERTVLSAAPGRRRERYLAVGVHDFAWFAGPQLLERQAEVDNVSLRLFAPPGHEQNVEDTLRALRFGLPHYRALYGPYPYPTLTVVHPPDCAFAAGGMEYPELMTTGGPWYSGLFGVRAIESVVLHELAHQWFQGMIASNEVLHPLLDEGLASYAEAEALAARYGSGSALDWGFLTLSEASLRRRWAADYARSGSLDRPASSFSDFRSLSGVIYGRMPTLLETFGRVWGKHRLEKALSDYARSTRFTHPGPESLVAAIERHLGTEAAVALRTAMHEDGWVDYAVTRLWSRSLHNPQVERARYLNRVEVRRQGTLRFPVDVDLVYEDGTRTRVRYDGQERSRILETRGWSKIVFARVDPDHAITLDDDLGNNQRAVRPAPLVPPRASQTITSLVQFLLTLLGP